MRVLMFARFYFPHIGGVEKHTQKISEILLKKNFKICLITEKYEDNLADREEINGIKVFRVKLLKKLRWFNKLKIWLWLLKNIRLIKEADIVHCHDIFFWYLPFRFLFPKKPVYVTFHGWEGKFPIPKRYILARKIWEKLAWGNICVGDFLKKWYGTKPNFVTYGGVDYDDGQHLVPKKNKVVFVGRLEKDLGILTYLKILEKMKRRKIDLDVNFYGDGLLRKEAEKYGKVFGFIKNVFSKIKEARFVFASSYLVLLEALSMRRIVIFIWENPLKRDYILFSPFRDLLISGCDPDELSNKISYFINHPNEEKKLVEKGYRWAITQTWEKVADLYLKLWGKT